MLDMYHTRGCQDRCVILGMCHDRYIMQGIMLDVCHARYHARYVSC